MNDHEDTISEDRSRGKRCDDRTRTRCISGIINLSRVSLPWNLCNFALCLGWFSFGYQRSLSFFVSLFESWARALRNIWRQLCFLLGRLVSTRSRSWDEYICIETGEIVIFLFVSRNTRDVKIFELFQFYLFSFLFFLRLYMYDFDGLKCEFSSIFEKQINYIYSK